MSSALRTFNKLWAEIVLILRNSVKIERNVFTYLQSSLKSRVIRQFIVQIRTC